MVTQELLIYIRGEVAKGRTREEIHRTLVSNGGWSEEDMSEAFREVIPMPSPIQNINPTIVPPVILPKEKPPTVKPTPVYREPSTNFFSSLLFKVLIIIIILILLGLAFWYYRPKTQVVNTPAEIPEQPLNTVANCGTNIAPKLNDPSSFENNPVLSCLGAKAINCENAKGIVRDDFFPTSFEIIKSGDSCNFRLSYPADSALFDVTGKKMAGQYITCPMDIVKGVDNNNSTSPNFFSPDKTNLSKYASQIYLYGTLGLFIESELDRNKIQALGCSGSYIDSVIASFNNRNK